MADPSLVGAGSDPASVSSALSAVLLSLAAGSATGVGGLLVLLIKGPPSPRLIGFVLSFAAGVMACVSFFELWLPFALGSFNAFVAASLFAGVGALLCRLLRELPTPEPEALLGMFFGDAGGNGSLSVSSMHTSSSLSSEAGGLATEKKNAIASLPSDTGDLEKGTAGGLEGGDAPAPQQQQQQSAPASIGAAAAEMALGAPASDSPNRCRDDDRKEATLQASWRLGILLISVLTLHNFPEGLAVGLGALKNRSLGLVVCGAIFAHNVAEGVVVAVPILAGTGNWKLALTLTALSGMSEPIGALIGVVGMRSGLISAESSAAFIDASLCLVAGIMVAVSFQELLPQARKLGFLVHEIAFGFACGGLMMGMVSLLID